MEILQRNYYINKIYNALGKGEVVVLTGHRRAGKSCILENLATDLALKGNVIYLDMEDPDNASISDYQALHQYTKSHLIPNKHNYLLIDEVQEIAQFEKALRYTVKQENVDVIITGSNAMMLSSEIATVFAGRYTRIHIFSLDYLEFLQFYNMKNSEESLAFYLRWGGLPFLHNIPDNDQRAKNDYLGSIYDTIFMKDIVIRRQIRNVTFLDNLARFVADNSGKLFSSNSIAKYMKGKTSTISINTIDDYMNALCDTYMIDRVERFDIKGKRVFERQEKYYFEDTGIRNYLCSDKRNTDLEKVVENIVYLKLKHDGHNVYVGQIDGKEIDFVTKRGDDIAYYQVSLDITAPDTYEREFGNLKIIKDNHPKYVITLNPLATLVNDEGIKTLTLREFLSKES